MASTSNPSAAQFQLPKDQKHAQDVQAKVHLAGAADSTTQLTVQQLVCIVTPPTSESAEVATYKLPPLHLWKNKFFIVSQIITAPGGEAKFVLGEDGTTDAIGDNLTATGDYAVLFNNQGEALVVVAEVTT